MSAAVPLAGFTPARELPNREMFYSPWGLFDYQIDGIAEIYVRTALEDGGYLPVWDTGIGKTVLGIASAAYLFADGEIDQVIVVCERNKRYDWRDEFEKFTALSVLLYHGTGRQAKLAKAGSPHVLVTTYETGKVELMRRVKAEGKRGKGSAADGPLVTALGLRGKRTLWIFDESTKLKNRSTEVHKAFSYILGQLRRGPYRQRVVGLTATPMDRGYVDAYNVGLVICPSRMPLVKDFNSEFVSGQDRYGSPIFNDFRAPAFARLFRGIMGRKRKTDPDVIDQFPKMIERSVKVEMSPDEAAFAQAVQETGRELLHEELHATDRQREGAEGQLWTVMRMTAGHPASHLHTTNRISQAVVEALGPDMLRSIGSAKTQELIERLRPVVKGQGDQAVVFTFFTSVLREVARELRAAGFVVAEYAGHLADRDNEKAKAAFLAGDAEILLCSDIGARGLNLPCSYVFEYESALTYSNRLQRINRAHRITSTSASVTATTLVLTDTVEQNIFAGTIDRNEQQDILVGDEEDGTAFISATTRREMLDAHRRKRKR